jgi:hypothetical protein
MPSSSNNARRVNSRTSSARMTGSNNSKIQNRKRMSNQRTRLN